MGLFFYVLHFSFPVCTAAIAAALSGGSSLDSRLAAASVIDRLNQTLEASAMAASQPRSVNEWTALSAELEINDFVQNAR